MPDRPAGQVQLAVVLAAGMGSRLGKRTSHIPKGMLSIGGERLVERSIRLLRQAGIARVLIGTGHCADAYTAFAQHRPWVGCIHNPDYPQVGSMHTLDALSHAIDDDFLLLESDLLYEYSALEILLADTRPNLLLASSFTHSGDEVYLQLDAHQQLQKLSKKSHELSHANAELMGISRITTGQLQHMCNIFARQQHNQMDYEWAMAACYSSNPFAVRVVQDVLWCEIDEQQHYQRATSHILPRIRAREVLTSNLPRNLLLNPGPATTSTAVKMAQVVPDICPREQQFGELMQSISADLAELVANPADYTAVLFAASGTGAVEAVLASVVPPGKSLLVINNGAYGGRMLAIAKQYAIACIEYTSPPDVPIDMRKLHAVLDNHSQQLSHLAMVHNETTTGLLNDLTRVGQLAKEYGVQLIVDAMSSYAAIPINMHQQRIDYLCASANKNIQGMAGVSFVIASNARLQALADIPAKSHYFDLHAQYQNAHNTGQMRFTPPVQVLYALRQAINETRAEGVAGRYTRYSQNWQLLVDGLERLGLTHLVEPQHHSKIITAINMPDWLDFDQLHNHMLARGYTIYPGKLPGKNCFRIANIGTLDGDDMRLFLQLLEDYLHIADQPAP